MGREIKRVPFDFNWPLNKVWDGYLNPYYSHSKPCPFCNGIGEIVDEDCEFCSSTGIVWETPVWKELCDAWKEIEPPLGDGWQVWEIISEGSPISPVFKTSEDLIEYLIHEGHSRLDAERFVKSGWCLSTVVISGLVLSDIDSCELLDKK